MRKKLERSVGKLCWLYPPLEPKIRYSSGLSQREVNAFAAFANGHLTEVVQKNVDSKTQAERAAPYLHGSTALSRIKYEDVTALAVVLGAAMGREAKVSKSMRGLVEFLQQNNTWRELLAQVYSKIVESDLAGTCPLVIAKAPWYQVLFPPMLLASRFQEQQKLIHESIEYVLEEESIVFDDVLLDKGLVTYLHEHVAGRFACRLHYTGPEGKQYRDAATVFHRVFDKYPRSAIVPLLKQMVGDEDLKQSLKDALPEGEFASANKAF